MIKLSELLRAEVYLDHGMISIYINNNEAINIDPHDQFMKYDRLQTDCSICGKEPIVLYFYEDKVMECGDDYEIDPMIESVCKDCYKKMIKDWNQTYEYRNLDEDLEAGMYAVFELGLIYE